MQLLKSRPCHVPFSWTGAKDPLLGSGDESDPHVSSPSFRLVSENACLRDLDRPSSQSKTASVSGQAEMGPINISFWRAVTLQRLGMAKIKIVAFAHLDQIFQNQFLTFSARF